MELKIFRDAMPQASTVCTVKAELPLETEILVSDYLPPVFKLVKCFAKPVILQKQLQPGRLTLEGYLRCTVYYQGEEGAGLCQTEQKLPFTKQLELPEFDFTAWTAVVEGQTEYLNSRVVNPRRMEVRGAVGLVATVRTQNKAEVITALADGGIEQQLDTLQGVRSIAVLDKLISAEGELAFPSPPAAVLDIAGTANAQEVRLLSGKAVVKGEVRVQCAWRAEQETELQSLSTTLPFQQVLDVDGLTEDCKCLCVVEPVGFSLTEGQPDAAGTLSASLMLHLRAWRSYQLQYAADAFSTRFETELVPQELAGCRGTAACLFCIVWACQHLAAEWAGRRLGADSPRHGHRLCGEQPGRAGQLRKNAGAFRAHPGRGARRDAVAAGMLAEYRQRTVYLHRRNSYRNHHRPG